MITPQGGETAVQPPAEAASSVRSFLWDSAGVGGVRLHSPTAAGTEGRRGGSSDSPPFVKGRELAVSPRRIPRALYFAGFSISNNARTPTVVREQSGESISGEAPRLKGNLTRTYGRRGLAPRLFFVRRGEESHSSSFRDCHKGSAWQTVAHHLLEKKKKEIMSDEMHCLSCRGDESVDMLQQRPSGFELSGSDLPKVCMRKKQTKT